MYSEWLKQLVATANEKGQKDGLWAHFDEVLPGDEIWSFSSPPETWRSLCGRSGFAHVRYGRIMDYHITMMN